MAPAQDEEIPVEADVADVGEGVTPRPARVGDGRRRSGYAVCPYLLVPDGGFRLSRADRDHRCVATRPPDAPSLDRQRRLCLTADHRSCPAFEAARERRAATLAEAGLSPGAVEARRARPFVRTTPLVLSAGKGGRGRETGGPSAWASAGPQGRRAAGDATSVAGGRVPTLSRTARGVGLAAIIVLAAAAFVVARLPPGAPGASPSGSAAGGQSGAAVAASASVAPSVTPPSSSGAPAASSAASAPPASPAASPAPSQTPGVTPAPSVALTYTVRAGDTLSAIAARYHVSVADLQALNGIKDPRLLRIGQVLKIP